MTYALQIDGGVLGLHTAVKAIFEIRRASGVGNFVIIPEYTEIEVDLVLGEGEVFLTPNTVGSIYQCKFVRSDDVTVGQFFFEMPSTNVMLSTLKKITAWPNELISNDELNESVEGHKDDLANPHQVTAEQVGLGNVDNTSDADKPVSIATQTAVDNLNQSIATEEQARINGDQAQQSYTDSRFDVIAPLLADTETLLQTYAAGVVMNISFPFDCGLISDTIINTRFDLGAL